MAFKALFCVGAGIVGTAAYSGEQPPLHLNCDQYVGLNAEDILHIPGAPQSYVDCMMNCHAHCPNPSDVSCLVNDALAGCHFIVEKATYYDTDNSKCAPKTFKVSLPALSWSTLYDSELRVQEFQSLGDVYVRNSTDCSTAPTSSDTLISCLGMGQCELVDWLKNTTGEVNIVGVDTTGKADLKSLTNVQLYWNKFVYGESSTCKAITDEKQCTAAGCFYCNNLDNPTVSGYTGCGVSPSECPTTSTKATTTTTKPTTTTTKPTTTTTKPTTTTTKPTTTTTKPTTTTTKPTTTTTKPTTTTTKPTTTTTKPTTTTTKPTTTTTKPTTTTKAKTTTTKPTTTTKAKTTTTKPTTTTTKPTSTTASSTLRQQQKAH